MICRARPQYIERKYSKKELLDNSSFKNSFYKNRYYFTRGSYSLQFILDCYKNYLNKKLRVGVQSFTCVSVLEAILNSGNIACLYDVSIDDCSIDFESIKPEHELDVLIITHYQGIPNKSYEQIAIFCKENNIFLIEDCSHGVQSKINGKKIGSLSNIYIESYAWDKPYTSLTGGAFVINNTKPEFKTFLNNEFLKISVEKKRKALSDIKTIYWLLSYTTPENYYEDIDYSMFFTKSFLRYFYCFLLGKNSFYRKLFLFIFKCINRVHKSKKLTLQRLNPVKISFIEKQRNIAEVNDLRFDKPAYLDDLKGLTFFENDSSHIKWNRYSFIADDEQTLAFIKSKGIQAGHFNWPVCLHQIRKNNSINLCLMTNFNNSEYLSKHIINMPLWYNSEKNNDE